MRNDANNSDPSSSSSPSSSTFSSSSSSSSTSAHQDNKPDLIDLTGSADLATPNNGYQQITNSSSSSSSDNGANDFSVTLQELLIDIQVAEEKHKGAAL